MCLTAVSKMKYLIFACVFVFFLAGAPKNGDAFTAESALGVVFLSPGDSKSVNFELRDVLFAPGSFYPLIVMAASFDSEIRSIDIAINTVGDIGTELLIGSTGCFFSLAALSLNLFYFEFLPPILFYGNETANYRIDVNPFLSLGLLFTGIVSQYEYYDDFPIYVTVTLTMSN